MQASKSGAIALDAKTAGGDNSNELVYRAVLLALCRFLWASGTLIFRPPLRQRHKCCAASQSDTASISASVSSALPSLWREAGNDVVDNLAADVVFSLITL